MTDFAKVEQNLTALGYTVKTFATGAEAAAYLNGAIDGTTVICWLPITRCTGTG